MINISIPNNSISERSYIIEVIFNEFLGIPYQLNVFQNDFTSIEQNGINLQIADGIFTNYDPLSFNSESIKVKWVSVNNLRIPSDIIKHNQIPLLVDDNTNRIYLIETADRWIEINFDLLGFCFLMLSRIEELENKQPDKHGRFVSNKSLAVKFDFIDRPVVNEYIEILWYYLKKTFPSLNRKKRFFKIKPTHDVDIPYGYQIDSYSELIKRNGIDTLKNLSFSSIPYNFQTFNAYKKNGVKNDPLYTFDFIMDSSEKNELQSEFYFITDQKKLAVNGTPYLMTDKPIQNLLKDINNRGHIVGIHPSYNTYDNKIQLKKEFLILKNICEQLGINQNNWGGRQHALRWKTPQTASNYEYAGINYDSTLTFADRAGFRCGICYEYTMFDVLLRKPINLKQKPLIAMEVSVIENRYMNLGIGSKALAYFNQLKEECRFYKGDYILLWHNDKLIDFENKDLYLKVISKNF